MTTIAKGNKVSEQDYNTPIDDCFPTASFFAAAALLPSSSSHSVCFSLRHFVILVSVNVACNFPLAASSLSLLSLSPKFSTQNFVLLSEDWSLVGPVQQQKRGDRQSQSSIVLSALLTENKAKYTCFHRLTLVCNFVTLILFCCCTPCYYRVQRRIFQVFLVLRTSSNPVEGSYIHWNCF